MKLLAVFGYDDRLPEIIRQMEPLGFEFVCYTSVLKALDNIDEINPQAVIVSAQDFPRHWKILVQFVRDTRSKDECPIILLKGQKFSIEESAKASFLGVTCLGNDGDALAELEPLLNNLSQQKKQLLSIMPWHRFGFLFARPFDKLIIPGELTIISTKGISFKPAAADLLKDIEPGTEITECSLRLGDGIYSPVCRIVNIGTIVSMEFVSFPDSGNQALKQYLGALSA